MSYPAHPKRKPVFDTVRALLDRALHQREVDAIDAALDEVIGDGCRHGDIRTPASDGSLHAATARTPALPSRIGPLGVELIKRFEGCARTRPDGAIEAYPDPGTGAEPWTIGWGATGLCHVHGGRIRSGTVWTQAQCDERFERDLARYAAEVADALGSAPRTQAQFDAMVSFHYNTGAIHRATLTRRHLSGDWDGTASEFARWNRAGGRVLRGLVRRRAEEARLYQA